MPRKKPTTAELPGLGNKKSKAIQAAAEEHQEAKNAFQSASERCQETKGKLIARMQKFGEENPDYRETAPDGSGAVVRYKLPDGEVIVATMKRTWDVKIKAAKTEEATE